MAIRLLCAGRSNPESPLPTKTPWPNSRPRMVMLTFCNFGTNPKEAKWLSTTKSWSARQTAETCEFLSGGEKADWRSNSRLAMLRRRWRMAMKESEAWEWGDGGHGMTWISVLAPASGWRRRFWILSLCSVISEYCMWVHCDGVIWWPSWKHRRRVFIPGQ